MVNYCYLKKLDSLVLITVTVGLYEFVNLKFVGITSIITVSCVVGALKCSYDVLVGLLHGLNVVLCNNTHYNHYHQLSEKRTAYCK